MLTPRPLTANSYHNALRPSRPLVTRTHSLTEWPQATPRVSSSLSPSPARARADQANGQPGTRRPGPPTRAAIGRFPARDGSLGGPSGHVRGGRGHVGGDGERSGCAVGLLLLPLLLRGERGPQSGGTGEWQPAVTAVPRATGMGYIYGCVGSHKAIPALEISRNSWDDTCSAPGSVTPSRLVFPSSPPGVPLLAHPSTVGCIIAKSYNE